MTDPNGFVIAAAISVFVGAYELIATEWVHRVRAALGDGSHQDPMMCGRHYGIAWSEA